MSPLHPAYDQVDIDQLSTALACMTLHKDLAPGQPGHALIVAQANGDARAVQAVGAARLLWHSEAQRALMNAEATRCFDC